MGLIKIDDIMAYWIGEQLVCPEHYDEKTDEFTGLVLRDEYEKEEYIYICDRGEHQI